MKLSYDITVSEECSLVVLDNAPTDLCFVASVFEAMAAADINIDMISQAPPKGAVSGLSFTLPDNDLGKTLEVIAQLREIYSQLKSAVSSGNCKVLVSSEEMREQPGIAARVFKAAAIAHADVRLITTSEIDISLLITQPQVEAVLDAIRQALAQ